jgi:hypothetical protein
MAGVCVCVCVCVCGGKGQLVSAGSREGEGPVVIRPLLSLKKRPHFKTFKSLGRNKNITMGTDATRNQDFLCWRGPAAL